MLMSLLGGVATSRLLASETAVVMVSCERSFLTPQGRDYRSRTRRFATILSSFHLFSTRIFRPHSFSLFTPSKTSPRA